jgi:hypothetical protein
MRQPRKAHTVLFGIAEGKRSLETPRRRRDDYVEIN